MVDVVVSLSNDMVILILMLLGYKRMLFVIWILCCWNATLALTLQSRVPVNPEGMMGHGVGPYLGLDEIGSPSLMIIFIIISYLFNCTFWIYPLVPFDLSVSIFWIYRFGFSISAYK